MEPPTSISPLASGQSLHALLTRLYPICRSITGNGVRQTLQILQEVIPITVHEVPTGTQVFDWTIPDEWNIRDAHVSNSAGQRVIDFQKHNLHVVNYSVPVRATFSLEQLKPYLHTLPDRPDVIPYRTSYYKPTWGFCLTHRQLESLQPDQYEVVIDADLSPGHLSYGELLLPGRSSDEILLSAHVCHPSLANDNLSGIVALTSLAARLGKQSLRHSVRFIFAPGTIGAITWLAANEAQTRHIRHGLVVSCIGDSAGFTYKRSRRGDAAIDRAVAQILTESNSPHTLLDFSPYGYDERQYCSPGFNLPVGLLMRSHHGQFPEYHTSADDLNFVKPDKLAESVDTLEKIIHTLDRNVRYVNLNPKCEPQLGRRGLYSAAGGHASPRLFELAMLWVLNQSDGSNDLLEIARKSGLPFSVIADAAEALCKHHLLRENLQ